MKKISIKDVALEAGVSTALVSYVLNGRHTDRINKDTADRIKQIAKRLNYRPNFIAQSLKLKKTQSIGLIVSNIANPFSSHLAREIENAASKKGFTLLIGSSDESVEKSEKLIETFRNRQVDGFIIAAAAGTESQLIELQASNTPFVLVDRSIPSIHTKSITVDNFEASAGLIHHLYSQGYSKIAIISFHSKIPNLTERISGAVHALSVHKVENPTEDVYYVNENDVQNEVANVLTSSIIHKYDAVYLVNNTLSIATLKYLLKNKISVPNDIAIATFDQADAAELFYAPLTYIQQPIKEIGIQAVDEIIKEMNSVSSEEQKIILPTTLIIGASTTKKE